MKIGLETHVTLNTKTKLFCACSTAKAEPNAHTCQTCLGLPGAKPTLNRRAVELAVIAAMALNFSIRSDSRFARKNYYYPDLAKNFQITQYDEPLAYNGFLEANSKKILLTRLHLEEDPAQILYPYGNIASSPYVLLDYNRSGTPLIEIVTAPCLENPREAKAYLEELFKLLGYLGVINTTAERVMKTDANISIEGGERVEIKNITSFAAVEKALQAEYFRQKKLVQQGKQVERQTRLYSEETNTTVLMRTKEQEEEYGYIVEPDLPPLQLTTEFIESVKNQMRELPDAAIERLSLRVPRKYARVLVYQNLADYFEALSFADKAYAAKWLCEDFLKCLNYTGQEPDVLRPSAFEDFLDAIQTGKITERAAKEYIQRMVKDKKNLGEILKRERKKIDEIQVAKKIVEENLKTVEEYKQGKTKALEFLVGEFLKTYKGLHPNEVRELLRKLLHLKKK